MHIVTGARYRYTDRHRISAVSTSLTNAALVLLLREVMAGILSPGKVKVNDEIVFLYYSSGRLAHRYAARNFGNGWKITGTLPTQPK